MCRLFYPRVVPERLLGKRLPLLQIETVVCVDTKQSRLGRISFVPDENGGHFKTMASPPCWNPVSMSRVCFFLRLGWPRDWCLSQFSSRSWKDFNALKRFWERGLLALGEMILISREFSSGRGAFLEPKLCCRVSRPVRFDVKLNFRGPKILVYAQFVKGPRVNAQIVKVGPAYWTLWVKVQAPPV